MAFSNRGARIVPWPALIVCAMLAVGLSLTHLSAESAPNTAAEGFPMRARIGANIWLQTAAEYRACCQTIYRSAERQLQDVLQSKMPKPDRPAVVMDLDETVFDNSAFQTLLYENHFEYSDQRWLDYERNYPQDVTLIPGAKHFIEFAGRLGVTVVFLTNRSEQNRSSTVSVLRRLFGVDPTQPVDRLYLRDAAGSNDKASRREAVASRFNVLMYFGDNLRDFSEVFRAPHVPTNASQSDRLAAIAERKSLVDQADCHWGIDWFVIPNPVYGEWEKLIGPDPMAIMHPTSMKTVFAPNR